MDVTGESFAKRTEHGSLRRNRSGGHGRKKDSERSNCTDDWKEDHGDTLKTGVETGNERRIRNHVKAYDGKETLT